MKPFLVHALIVLVVILTLLLIYGVLVEPYLLDQRHEKAVIPNLPVYWAGKKVMVMSDFQFGMWMNNKETVRKAVNAVVAEQPQAVLILGDFVYHAAKGQGSEIDTAAEILRPLVTVGVPTFAVLGNHDYGVVHQGDPIQQTQVERIKNTLTKMGIHVLSNQAVSIGPPNEQLFIVGIAPEKPGTADINEALKMLPASAPRIVVMHNPDTFARLPANSAPLAAAGHTHGGQIRIPFTPEWSWLTFKQNEEVHADGWIPDYGAAGNHLYVNRGIGFSVVPIRINCMPELTVFTLQPE